ncbi:hypothetical protein Ct9H90mP29_20060 [bacterium]|nr:MAG: hypothetical protein Ct9H90mP29_20060 [bacterium]
MEWLGILLLYLISGFIKKRKQNQSERIESDPDWDLDDSNVFEKPESDIGQLLNDPFLSKTLKLRKLAH